jgi:hypothetical protein
MTDKPDVPVKERESPDALADIDPKKVSPAETEKVKGGGKAVIGNIPR